MRTSSPLTALSYVPLGTLVSRLSSLSAHGYLDFWGLIPHKGERLDFGILADSSVPALLDAPRDKDHIHLYLQPGRLIDTSSLDDVEKGLSCIDPTNPIPLKTVGWRKCKSFLDWYLYNLHYDPYLRTKLETKEFHYSPSDFVWSDLSVAQMYVQEALSSSSFAKQMRIRDFLSSGGSVSQLAFKGVISPGEAFAYRTYGDLYSRGAFELEGRKTCTIDESTGEVLRQDDFRDIPENVSRETFSPFD